MSFDDWVNLYNSDKELFEKTRKEVIEDEILKIEKRDSNRGQRLRAIMWAQEQRLSLIKNDTERFNQVVSGFWKQFEKFQDNLDIFLEKIVQK